MVVPSSPWPWPRRTLHCNTTATPSQARHCCVRHDLSPGRARSGGDGGGVGLGALAPTRATIETVESSRGEDEDRTSKGDKRATTGFTRKKQNSTRQFWRGWKGNTKGLPHAHHDARASRRRGLYTTRTTLLVRVVVRVVAYDTRHSIEEHSPLPSLGVARCSCWVGSDCPRVSRLSVRESSEEDSSYGDAGVVARMLGPSPASLLSSFKHPLLAPLAGCGCMVVSCGVFFFFLFLHCSFRLTFCSLGSRTRSGRTVICARYRYVLSSLVSVGGGVAVVVGT